MQTHTSRSGTLVQLLYIINLFHQCLTNVLACTDNTFLYKRNTQTQ